MLAASAAQAQRPWAGWPLLAFGLLLYVLGRSQGIMLFEISSIIAGAWPRSLLVKRGARALRVLWFPFFFMLFMVPLPARGRRRC